MAMKFKKRVYGSWSEFFADLLFILRNVNLIIRAYWGGVMPAAFRERLMVAVTAVYGCRFCTWFHTREALRGGLDRGEIVGLLSSTVGSCPEEEAIALAYAQHWAECNANPDSEAVQRLEQAYGTEKAKALNAVLRLVRCGNLTGNSLDYLLYRISFGRWRR
jgi:AhpD family alkylhydroperoxidase